MATKRKKLAVAPVWNAGTIVNVLLIPFITVVFMAGGFYAVSTFKFTTYDKAASDVAAILLHNAAQDVEVKGLEVSLDKISGQLDALRRAAPISGPGSGGGSAVGGGFQTKH
jgi:hypothetical protein